MTREQYFFDNPLTNVNLLFGDIDVNHFFEEQVDLWSNTDESDRAHVNVAS
jgi:hypothetical protein